MTYTENENEIIDVVRIRDVKAKPGAASIYLGQELFPKIDMPIDTNLLLRYDKKKREICIRLLTY
jgi:hypothetical protein